MVLNLQTRTRLLPLKMSALNTTRRCLFPDQIVFLELCTLSIKVLQMTLDMESVFRRKVEEKEEKMVRTSKEEEEKVELSRKELEEVREALERKRSELEEEKRAWESENNTSLAGILLAGRTFQSLVF